MSWTHRIAQVTTKRGEVYHDVREYFELPYGPAWTDGIAPSGEDIDDLIWAIRAMLRAALRAKRNPGLLLKLDDKGEQI
jgi:hypothetical protein